MILITVFVVAVVVAIYYIIRSFVEEGFLWALGTALLGMLGTFIAVAVTVGLTYLFAPMNLLGTSEQELEALGTDSSLEGRAFFLGGGYIDGERVVNYVTRDEHGGIRVKTADGEDLVIYEDATAETATVEVHSWGFDSWWTGRIPKKTTYTFHIPPDSVVESFEVSAE